MAKKLYVGNLSYGVTDSDLQNLFEPHGAVQSAQVIMDRDTGRSKGFGFVEMDSGEQPSGHRRPERPGSQRPALTVNEAQAREGGAPATAAAAAVRATGAIRALLNRALLPALLPGGLLFTIRRHQCNSFFSSLSTACSSAFSWQPHLARYVRD